MHDVPIHSARFLPRAKSEFALILMALRVLVASCPELTDARLFALTHPRTGAAVQFVRAGDALLQVHRFRDGTVPRSWLIGGQACR